MPSSARDLVRQIVVISAVSFMLVAAVFGTGQFGGTPVEDQQGGALDADATLLAPAGPAFSIWSVIYLLLIAYAIWQAFPSQRERDRQRALGWWIAATAVLNGLWIVLAQFATLPLTVVGIVALLVVLCLTFRLTVVEPAEGLLDSVFIDATTGLHLGWVSLATVANTTAWLTAEGPSEWAAAGETVAVILLIVVGLIGLAIPVFSGWRMSPGLAIGWGLSWLAVGRLLGEPESNVVGVTAAVVAVLVLGVSVVSFLAKRVVDSRNAGA